MSLVAVSCNCEQIRALVSNEVKSFFTWIVLNVKELLDRPLRTNRLVTVDIRSNARHTMKVGGP